MRVNSIGYDEKYVIYTYFELTRRVIYVSNTKLGKLHLVSIYQNTVGFLVHLAIAIYNSKILGEFLPFCAYVLCLVKVSFIAKVVHSLRSLAFKSKHIANRQSVASLFRRFWLLLSLVLGASLFR